jgi:probable biosynthetic protein (TIGR04098 family)
VSAGWNDYDFTVTMPYQAPPLGKLSEVEFWKHLASFQWESIAGLLGRPVREICNDAGERLYASFINVELNLGEHHSLERLGEGCHIRIKNRVNVFAGRFIEGLFVFDDQPIADHRLDGVEKRSDLESLGLPWAYMSNAFIAPTSGNVKLMVFKPEGMDSVTVPELEQTPVGIADQRRAQSTGAIEAFPDSPEPEPLAVRSNRRDDLISYSILPESDINGAGLVYFARYPAMMNYGERIFLSRHLEHPLSSQLNAFLSTERRRCYYFANASPGDTAQVAVTAGLLPPGTASAATSASRYRTPLKLGFRIDLYRASDMVLMASSLVRKSLNVPGDATSVLLEAERLLKSVSRPSQPPALL